MLLAGAGIGVGLLVIGRQPDPAPTRRWARPWSGSIAPPPWSATIGPAPRHPGPALGRSSRGAGTGGQRHRPHRPAGPRANARRPRGALRHHWHRMWPAATGRSIIAAGLGGHRRSAWRCPAGLALAFATGGALLPNLTVHADAERRRQSFKHALGAYLDLVSINLAAGRGVETALGPGGPVGPGMDVHRDPPGALPGQGDGRVAVGGLGSPRARTSASRSSGSWPRPSAWPATPAPGCGPRWPPRPAPCGSAASVTSKRRPSRPTSGCRCPSSSSSSRSSSSSDSRRPIASSPDCERKRVHDRPDHPRQPGARWSSGCGLATKSPAPTSRASRPSNG